MLTEILQKILAAAEQERNFYLQQLKPALHRLEHAEDLHQEKNNIEQLLSGTVFEPAFHRLNAAAEESQATLEHLYKLNHVCHDFMHNNHLKRQSEVDALLDSGSNQELNPIALYYLGQIYSQGSTAADCERAHAYLQQALTMPLCQQQSALSLAIRELLAQNYDRWQLRKNPPQPQKYGTIYADHYDIAQGLAKNQLIPPHPGYQYQIEALDQARQGLGLNSWAEQENQRRGM